MCSLTLTTSSGPVVLIDDPRQRRLLLTFVGLLSQAGGIPYGKLTLSWGPDTPIKWELSAHGHDAEGLPEKEN